MKAITWGCRFLDIWTWPRQKPPNANYLCERSYHL